ncbi:hypothetical protein JNUCC1_00996 [Lentibacillus sp. JNUCC-1]|uniref:hypothetical protein n=1 Tax=Lentibacillus sp. JNUCC-1 TaxID=2654513 RepID=UPI0012E77EBD|nr:hypothetical protein [Lentibacillus sp. JNUCC-1]MUV37190.1 hypothetical protein [Lentibacillus sp. JNUCC-1]
MDVGSVIPIASLILSIIIGGTGVMLMGSLKKRILMATGLKRFPKNPEERYSLLAKHCGFLSYWTNFDRFNLYLLVAGVILLIGALGITIYNLNVEGPLFLFQVQLGLLINAIAWIFLSSFFFIMRFVQVSNIYRYGRKMM